MEAGKLLSGLLVALAVATAGCVNAVTDEGVDAESVDAATENPTGIVGETHQGSVNVGVATPALSFNSGGAFSFPLEASGNVTGYVLELEWDAVTPASENLDLWVREAGAGTVPPEDPGALPPPGPLAKATGPSVLRLALAAEDLQDETAYEILVRAPSDMGAGAAIGQPFMLYVTAFEDVPFDSEYSVLG